MGTTATSSDPRPARFKLRPPTRITALGMLATGALGAVLCFVPGLDTPNYHAAFVTAVIGSLIAGPIGIAAAHRALAARASPFRGAFGATLPAALAPLALLLLNGLRVRQCDVLSGVGFMLIGPVFSMLWAGLLGAAIGVWRPRKLHAVPLFYAVFVVWAALDVWHIYQNPAIFAYNPFAGFFSGAIYDSVIVIDSRLLLYRLNNIAQIVAVVALVRAAWDPSRRRLSLSALGRASIDTTATWCVALTVCFAFWVSRGVIGYEVSRADVKRTLGKHLADERIALYYDRTIPDDEARALLEGHRFRLDQIEARLGRRFPRRITSYVYASSEQKRRLMGAATVYIAKPWLDEIHLNRVPYDHPVIRHELAHVVLGIFADPPLYIPTASCVLPQMALVEGAAEAFEWDTGQLSPHTWSAAMRESGRAPDLRTLLGPGGFYNQGSETAYTLSGSFVRWVMDRYGVEPLERIYRDGDFEGVLGQPIDELIGAWEGYLDSLAVPADVAGLATGRFNTPPIHQRPCGLDVARVEAQARARVEAGDIPGAADAYRQVVRWIPEDAMKRRPLVELAAKSGDLDSTLTAYWSYLAVWGNRNPVADAAMAELMADTFARNALSQTPISLPLLERAHRLYVSLRDVPQPEDRWRNTLIKIALSGEPERGASLLPYILTGLPELLQVAFEADPDDPLAAYLVARRYYNERRYAEALPLLESNVAALAELDAEGLQAWVPWVRREAARLRAFALWELGDYRLAEQAFVFVAELTPYDGDRERFLDWAERCRWKLRRLGQIGSYRSRPGGRIFDGGGGGGEGAAMASLDLDTAISRLSLAFGARVGRPVVHAGVVALPTALAPTAANLAALETAWRFALDDGGERGEEAGR